MKELKNEAESLQSCVSVSVTDLRIGNLIHYNGNHREIGKISLLVSDMVDALSYCQINYRRDKKHWLINLQPVELTEDWLIAFGLKKNNGYPYKFLNGFIKIRNGVYFYKYYHLDIELEFVHQLQNLYFAITGTELAYENETK